MKSLFFTCAIAIAPFTYALDLEQPENNSQITSTRVASVHSPSETCCLHCKKEAATVGADGKDNDLPIGTPTPVEPRIFRNPRM